MPNTSVPTLADLLRRWQSGWAACRGISPGVPVTAGLKFQLGLPGRQYEILALYADDDEEQLRREAAAVAGSAAATWFTVPTRHPETVRRLLTQAGLRPVGDTETFMTIGLSQHPDKAPTPPYRVDLTHEASVIRARVHTPSGVLAAHGMLAIAGSDAIAHNIVTTPEHRRKGLASAVMSALTQQAREHETDTGLLIASPQGRNLYERLGWRAVAEVLTVTC